jgi:hypothetical protein
MLLAGGTEASGQPTATPNALPPPDSIRALLPSGGTLARVMTLAVPLRLDTLSRLFQGAIARDPAWMLEYIRKVNAPPGKPLPYHPRLGVSEEEYREMLSLLEEVRFVPAFEAPLFVVGTEDGRYRLDGGVDMVELSAVVIDPERGVVSTPFGTLSNAEVVRPHPDQRATGPWAGLSWHRDDFDPETGAGVTVRFNLGRLTDSGDGMLTYEAKRMEGGALVESIDWDLRYPLAGR